MAITIAVYDNSDSSHYFNCLIVQKVGFVLVFSDRTTSRLLEHRWSRNHCGTNDVSTFIDQYIQYDGAREPCRHGHFWAGEVSFVNKHLLS